MLNTARIGALQRAMRPKFLTGDVFRFGDPLEGGGYGQILVSDILQYVVIFEPKVMDPVILEDIVSSTIIFAGWTMDARFLSGDWEIVGNIAPSGKFVFPNYKVRISGQTWLVGVEGNPLRVATAEEAETLPFKSSDSPIIFEEAFKAHHDFLPWEPHFESLRVKPR